MWNTIWNSVAVLVGGFQRLQVLQSSCLAPSTSGLPLRAESPTTMLLRPPSSKAAPSNREVVAGPQPLLMRQGIWAEVQKNSVMTVYFFNFLSNCSSISTILCWNHFQGRGVSLQNSALRNRTVFSFAASHEESMRSLQKLALRRKRRIRKFRVIRDIEQLGGSSLGDGAEA